MAMPAKRKAQSAKRGDDQHAAILKTARQITAGSMQKEPQIQILKN